MELECGGYKGGWTTIVKLDTSKGDSCPSGWTRITTLGDPIRQCVNQEMMLVAATLQSSLIIMLLLKKSVKLKATRNDILMAFALLSTILNQSMITM